MTDDASAPVPVPVPARVADSFQRLKVAAAALNRVSNNLGVSINVLDRALQELNLGISTWVVIEGDENDQNGNFWSRDLGYAKVGSKWGIALRTREGNSFMEEGTHEDWLFNDAPRALRITAVDRLPELIEKLIQEANSTAKRISDKIDQAQEVALAITHRSGQRK